MQNTLKDSGNIIEINNLSLGFDIDDKFIIVSHNLISYFCIKFSKRFEELKSKNFYIVPPALSKEDIVKEMDESYKEFSEIDPHAESYGTLSSAYVKFRKIEENINKIHIPPKPTENSEAYLFTENTTPVTKKRTDNPEYVNQTNQSKSSTTSMNNVEIKLPKIVIPSKSDLNTLTLSSLNNIYLQCLQGTRLLPIFVCEIQILKAPAQIFSYHRVLLRFSAILKNPLIHHIFQVFQSLLRNFSIL